MGSLLSSEHQNLALMRLHQMLCHLSSAFKALSLPGGGPAEWSNKPGLPWEGAGLLICSQGPPFRKPGQKPRVVIESI